MPNLMVGWRQLCPGPCRRFLIGTRLVSATRPVLKVVQPDTGELLPPLACFDCKIHKQAFFWRIASFRIVGAVKHSSRCIEKGQVARVELVFSATIFICSPAVLGSCLVRADMSTGSWLICTARDELAPAIRFLSCSNFSATDVAREPAVARLDW